MLDLLARFKNPRSHSRDAEAAVYAAPPVAVEQDSKDLVLEDKPWDRLQTPASAPQSETEAAIARCREAVQAMPNFARGHLRLALALYANNDYTEAILVFQKAARLGKEAGLSSADCGLAYCGLGCTLMAQSRSQEETALQAFAKALHFLTTPDFAPPSLLQGLTHYAEGQYGAAIAALRETLRLGPDEGLFGTDPALAHCALGCALAAQGTANRDAAFQEFQQAFFLLRQNPNLP
jgi:tetratricopeptide (TPR) repeat protein